MIQKITDDIKYKEYKKVFANNLKRFREREGLTQEQLAEKLNVDPTTISRYETAKRELTTSMIPHICSVLHITPNELFGLNTSEQKMTARTDRRIWLIRCNSMLNLLMTL